MTDILETIIAHKRKEVEEAKKLTDIATLELRCLDAAPTRSMKKALTASATGIIAEFKRRSPSKGDIHAGADAALIPPAYEKAGASALSILTDSRFFGGSADDIVTARPLVGLPILRKEFVIDEYQLYEARALGADAVLLIASALTVAECRGLTSKTHSLGMEVLLEIHSEEELKYVDCGADMVGVNNRHLGTFVTDVATSFALAELLPEDVLRVSESGLSSPQTVRELRTAGYRGFLMGEHFMRSASPADALQCFISQLLTP